jgi:hypothetical protein
MVILSVDSWNMPAMLLLLLQHQKAAFPPSFLMMYLDLKSN